MIIHLSISVLSAMIFIEAWFVGGSRFDAPSNALIKIGVILEKRNLNSQVLNEIEAEINRQYKPNIEFQLLIAKLDEVNPYMAVQHACQMIYNGVGIFISVSSCSTYFTLAGLATEKNVVHVGVNLRNCYQQNWDTQVYYYSLPFQVDMTNTVDVVLGEIVRLEKWPSVVLLYDETIFRERALSIKACIQKKTHDIKFHEIKLFLENNRSAILETRLKDIIKDGEFFNFIILASQQNTVKIVLTAKQLGVKGKEYNWIIANHEIDEDALNKIDNSTRAVAILRKHMYSNVEPSSKSSTPSDVTEQGIYDYFFDSVQVAAQVANLTQFQINWDGLRAVSCATDSSAIFAWGDKLLSAIRKTNFVGKTGQIKHENFSLIDYITLRLKHTVSEKPTGSHWVDIGYWDRKNDLNLTTEKAFEVGYSSLQDMTLKIVTIEEHPFIIKSVKNGQVSYEGCCIDILKAIQKELHNDRFNYVIYEVEDNQYGVEVDGRWTGLIGDILYKKAHMAVAGMIRNYDRELVVDFTASYMDYGVSILIPKPQKTTSIFGFLEPLTVQVWICISIATFGIGLMLFLLSRLSPFSRHNQLGTDEFNLKNSMWFALASLMQQGGDATPLCISGRILGTFWWFFTLIIIATYTANLAAFLTVTRMETPIESLDGLASQTRIPYGTVSPSSLEQFFKEQSKIDPLYERIYNYMDTADPSPMVIDEDEGIRRVLEGNYAFLWDDPVLQYHRKLHCDKLTTVGKPFNRKNYAFAVPKGAPYWETITMSILRLQESGELDKIKAKWFEGESACADDDTIGGGKEAEGIALKNVAGVFYILAMGAGLAFVTAAVELLWHRYMRARKDRLEQEATQPQPQMKLHVNNIQFSEPGRI